jgi:hypothetical protein
MQSLRRDGKKDKKRSGGAIEAVDLPLAGISFLLSTALVLGWKFSRRTNSFLVFVIGNKLTT